MGRPFRQQIDEGIVDRAAALFARRGFAQTSVQAIADAAGYSKAGLLHHYPSKNALRDAALAQSRTLAARVLAQVAELPPGPVRDLRAVQALVDLALARPGLVALLLSSVTAPEAAVTPDLDAITASVFEAFGTDMSRAEPERVIRITGALAALAVLTLAAHDAGETAAWRSHVIAASFDALGHPRAAARSDQVEA
ncbi:TetR/AcrR family transcriptional regulator [Pseudonocardia acidicola]|uniref:Helix-turn-helix transcriptional regulator n=1 Tax=Pseudonocardia acidicola TaxID=2724939 RepID=A0ABX1SKR3_9PSEU|nr:TetR/AcrR family transcriptional regulator [Pseudonocardia acidicola]NMI00982.1 helix-turn-helix transcriptional regulator [Pseudonocardia acidicola]